MWFAPVILLSLLGIALVVVPSLLLALSDRPARRRAHAPSRPSCVHQFASAATGIACPCMIRGWASAEARGGELEEAEAPSEQAA